MKIGVSTLASQGQKLEDFLNQLEDLNIEYVEFLHEYPNKNYNKSNENNKDNKINKYNKDNEYGKYSKNNKNSNDNKITKDILESYSFKYTIHSPISDLNIASLNSAIQKATIAEIKNSIDLASEINAELVVVHPGRITFLARFYKDLVKELAHKGIEECQKYGNDVGIAIAVENMPNMEGYLYQDVSKLDSYLNQYNHDMGFHDMDLDSNKNIGMVLDIGHKNTIDSYKDSYFKSTKHIHLSDNNGDFDHHYPLGEGSIDFKMLFNEYEQNNYEGIYVLELNDIDSVKKSLNYLKDNKII